MNWCAVAEGIATSVGAGLLLAMIFFLLRDVLFAVPIISGHWLLEVRTTRTDQERYDDMRLYYVALLWQDGRELKGTGEKVFEDANGAVLEYKGLNRVQFELNGFVGKRFLSRDDVVVHIKEFGQDQHGNRRPSSAVHTLKIYGRDTMKGSGATTVANQQLKVSWSRVGENGADYKYSQPKTRRVS